MTDEQLPVSRSHCDGFINSHLLPLRDRIIKVEATLEYHDREFGEIKTAMKELTSKVEETHRSLIKKVSGQHKDTLDVLYEHVRTEEDKFTRLFAELQQGREETTTRILEARDSATKSAQQNTLAFAKFETKWKASWAALAIIAGLLVWGGKVIYDTDILSFGLLTEDKHREEHKNIDLSLQPIHPSLITEKE